jgi:hypothetical protein
VAEWSVIGILEHWHHGYMGLPALESRHGGGYARWRNGPEGRRGRRGCMAREGTRGWQHRCATDEATEEVLAVRSRAGCRR